MNPSEIAERAARLITEVRKFKNGWMSAAVLEEKLVEFERAIEESRGQRLEDSFEYQAGGSHVLLSALPDPPKGNENV